MVHSSKKASALEWSSLKMAGSLPLSFVPLLQSSRPLLGPATLGGPPPPPPPPPPLSPPSSGRLYGNPEPPNHDGSGAPGGSPPFRTEEVPSSTLMVCVGLVAV